MEILSDAEAPCLEKLQREAFLCLNTFPDKVTELNNLIDKHTPEAVKKNRENLTQPKAPSCPSITSTVTRDYYFHDGNIHLEIVVIQSYPLCRLLVSLPPDRVDTREFSLRDNLGKMQIAEWYLQEKISTLSQTKVQTPAHMLAALVSKLAACTHAVLIRPSKFIMETVAAMFLKRDQFKRVRCGASTLWKTMDSRENRTVAKNLICTMRPAAVRLIADTTILKRWLQALSLASSSPSPSLSQAIRTTETIDGWAYELFFHLKYLQVINFPCEVGRENEFRVSETESPGFPESDLTLEDDVMHTNLWHRIVQLRDHYVILFESLKSDNQFLDADDPKSICPVVSDQ